MKNKLISRRRIRLQSGVEAIEFAIFILLTTPMFVWMFINGMNFVILDKVTDVTRAGALMLVKNQDFTLSGTQAILASVATGLNLQVGTSGGISGTTTGDGLVIISTVEYVGTTTCSSCANIGHYVFTNRIFVGNTQLQFNGTTVASAFGNPSSTLWGPGCTTGAPIDCNQTNGSVANYLTDAGAQTNSSFGALFGTTPIGDSQIVYVVESYFTSQNSFGSGQFGIGGVYSRALM